MSLLPLKKMIQRDFTIIKYFSISLVGGNLQYWLRIVQKKNATFDPIFNNKTLLICKTCVNKTFVKLNCASYGLKNILYYWKFIDFSDEKLIFLDFWNIIITLVFLVIKIYKKCFCTRTNIINLNWLL
jgi:hypothetical protein